MKICKIEKGSVCSELDICAGDELIEIDGKSNLDCLDYIFYNSEEFFTLSIKKADGEIIDYKIEKDSEEDLGLVFSDFEIKPKSCKNKCIFCFVDQLPKNMRKTLYFKDDDYRLSFISGNYITLTNIKKNDAERIIKQRLSPLYFSIHSMDKAIRNKLLGKESDNPEELIKIFAKNGIEMHCQIVMCPGVNDGKDVINSVNILSKYYPNVKSVAIVPVGLTKFRDNLEKLKPVDKTSAASTITDIEKLQQIFIKKYEAPFVFLSDEFYIKAEKECPPYNFYGEFWQIENGVGMLAKFKEEFNRALQEVKIQQIKKNYCIITGKSTENFIKELLNGFKHKSGYMPDVIGVVNNFFGETITVSGLLTGTDIVAQFGGKKYDTVFLPKCLTKEFETVLLDDMQISDVEEKIKNKIKVIECSGAALVEALNS